MSFIDSTRIALRVLRGNAASNLGEETQDRRVEETLDTIVVENDEAASFA